MVSGGNKREEAVNPLSRPAIGPQPPLPPHLCLYYSTPTRPSLALCTPPSAPFTTSAISGAISVFSPTAFCFPAR